MSKAVREQVSHMARLHPSESIYVLSYEQSAELLKLDPAAIGYDPTILVYDLYARPGTGKGAYRGFRLNLGADAPPRASTRPPPGVCPVRRHEAGRRAPRPGGPARVAPRGVRWARPVAPRVVE